jgi:Metal binding domain of Ada
MIRHLAPGATPTKIGPLLRLEIIKFGGYRRDKIYGTLTCSAAKRMKVESRVFFQDENEALELGYRPCGRCVPETY